MTDAELIAEITNDPAGLGYATMTAQEIVNAINAPREGVIIAVIVPKADVLQILSLAPFRAAALPEPGRTGWLELLANIRSLAQGLSPLDMQVQGMLTQAVASDVLTAEEKMQIDALGQREGSRAEQLWGAGAVVSLNDVARVR